MKKNTSIVVSVDALEALKILKERIFFFGLFTPKIATLSSFFKYVRKPIITIVVRPAGGATHIKNKTHQLKCRGVLFFI